MNKKEIVIGNNDAGQRIDKFLTKAFPNMPQNMAQKLIRKKEIRLNGKRCECSDMLKEGDVLRIFAKEDLLCNPKPKTWLRYDFNKGLDAVYEDENILIVNKFMGMVCHEDDLHTEDTLVNRINSYLISKGEFSPESEASFAPALCNRLDKNTSGLVIAAKNAVALRSINEAIREGRVKKQYMCVTCGKFSSASGRLVAYHKKDETENIVSIKDEPCEGYKEIITEFEVVQSIPPFNLVRITLITGRTHQIRAHLAHNGTPIIGDMKYGNAKINKLHGKRYQLLCANRLMFNFADDSPLSYLNGKVFEHPLHETFTFFTNFSPKTA